MIQEMRNSTIYSEGFIKVLRCYESVIDAYKARCVKRGVEPNSVGDDIFKSQLAVCRNLHANWVQLYKPYTAYDADIIDGLSFILCRLVDEKLEDICKGDDYVDIYQKKRYN